MTLDGTSIETLKTNAVLVAGTIVDGKYQVLSEMGAGGMAVVYRARHLRMDRDVALKVVHPRLVSDSECVKRFLREAMSVCKLDHRHIVTAYGFGVWNEVQPYLAMELLPGRSLASLLKEEGALSEQRALPIFSQILEALSAAHAQGIVHRDVKPSNVMLLDNDFVKLMDFGIAKVLPVTGAEMQKLTQTNEILGTAHYMSPEQCLAMPLDGRSDLYSMACLMYEVLDGAPPFDGNSVFAVIARQLGENPRPSPVLKTRLGRIIERTLSKEPDNRPQSADELKALLLARVGTAAPPPSRKGDGNIERLVQRLVKPERRFGYRPSWVFVLLVLIALSAFLWCMRESIDIDRYPQSKVLDWSLKKKCRFYDVSADEGTELQAVAFHHKHMSIARTERTDSQGRNLDLEQWAESEENPRKAAGYAMQFLDTFPDNGIPSADYADALLQMGQASDRMGDHRTSLYWYGRASAYLEKFPQSPRPLSYYKCSLSFAREYNALGGDRLSVRRNVESEIGILKTLVDKDLAYGGPSAQLYADARLEYARALIQLAKLDAGSPQAVDYRREGERRLADLASFRSSDPSLTDVYTKAARELQESAGDAPSAE